MNNFFIKKIEKKININLIIYFFVIMYCGIDKIGNKHYIHVYLDTNNKFFVETFNRKHIIKNELFCNVKKIKKYLNMHKDIFIKNYNDIDFDNLIIDIDMSKLQHLEDEKDLIYDYHFIANNYECKFIFKNMNNNNFTMIIQDDDKIEIDAEFINFNCLEFMFSSDNNKQHYLIFNNCHIVEKQIDARVFLIDNNE